MAARIGLAAAYGPANEVLDGIDAKDKKFISFEHGAHFPMFSEPYRFVSVLMNKL